MFTADEAIEVSGTDEAEIISFSVASRIADEHGADIHDYLNEQIFTLDPAKQNATKDNDGIDAGNLLIWLGY